METHLCYTVVCCFVCVLALKGAVGQTCVDGCYKCISGTSICESCINGKYGEACDLNCTFADNCVNRLCYSNGLSCYGSCPVGKYGTTCELDCLFGDNCYNGICHRVSGQCSKCPDGKYGLSCTKDCPSDCALSYCQLYTGECSRTCEDGTYGDQCEKACLYDCRYNRCDSQSGDCTSGCADGLYGDNCTLPCPHNRCLYQRCQRYTPDICESGCIHGLYGENCDKSCDLTNCDSTTCVQTTGQCGTCKSGFYGDNCEKTCSLINCRYNNCDRYTGECRSCVYGKYGLECDKDCPGVCSRGYCRQISGKCDRTCYSSGECYQCAHGHYGEYCLKCLNTNCSTCNEGVECTSCHAGLYGPNCNRNCSFNCINTNGLPECGMENGTCLHGCYYGNGCLSSCQDVDEHCLDCTRTEINSYACLHCDEGFYISQDADDEGKRLCLQCGHCMNGTCPNDTGLCPDGCLSGYWGERCLRACSEGCHICDRLSGACLSIENQPGKESSSTGSDDVIPYAVGGAVGGIGLMALVVAIVVLIKARNKRNDASPYHTQLAEQDSVYYSSGEPPAPALPERRPVKPEHVYNNVAFGGQ